MKIAILIEGRTERAFKPFLLDFLRGQLAGRMPKLDFVPQDGGLPTNDKLKRVVEKLLQGASAADHVIAYPMSTQAIAHPYLTTRRKPSERCIPGWQTTPVSSRTPHSMISRLG